MGMGEPATKTTNAGRGSNRLLSVDEARARIVGAVGGPDGSATERVALERAGGRVLASDVVARLTMPRWPNSAMDGYALRFDDLDGAGLRVSQRVAAGSAPGPLEPGTAARIFTGAPVPEGADTVVMQEHCAVDGEWMRVERVPERGANIRGAGEDYAHGDTLLRGGCHLCPQHVALAASAGAATLDVHPRIRVALLVTGDELVAPDETLGDGQIHESNGHTLAALARALGAAVHAVERVPDDLAATREALSAAAAGADLVITSGGASVGDCDHVRDAACALGELDFFGIAVKPGKPLAFGHVAGTPLLVLPGNPVSLFVTFLLFGAPLVRRLQGRSHTMPDALWVPAGFEQARTRPRADYLRVCLEDGRAVPCGAQGSGLLRPTAAADGLACVPPHATVTPGEPLAYWPMAVLLT